jgi:hypothetical protein
MPTELILNKKKIMCLPQVSSIFRKVSPKTFGPHCVCLLHQTEGVATSACCQATESTTGESQSNSRQSGGRQISVDHRI